MARFVRNLGWVTACLLVSLLSGACDSKSNSGTGGSGGTSGTGSTGSSATSQPSGSITIAVIPKGTTHEFWKSIHAGAEQAAQETGVQVIWKGPLKEDDRDSQISTVENFVTRGVSGIVLAPLDDTALRAPVASAKQSGIPVVIIDSGLKSDDYVSFVATNNFHAGEMAGEQMVKLLNGKGRIVVLRYAEGSASTTEREKGFLAAVGKASGITVVSDKQYAGATTESAMANSENLLNPLRKPDGSGLTIDGVFCPNESSTFGMLLALKNMGAAGKVKFVGFDSSEKLVAGLNDGHIDALVIQNPMKMGYLGVKAMVDHLQGRKVEKQVDTGAQLVTKENMNQPDVAAVLHPDLKKWLKE